MKQIKMPNSTGNPEFIQAAEDVKSLAQKPSNDILLELYALFKQSIVGDINTGTNPTQSH